MANRKPSWPIWCAAVLLLPALYPLSYGPAMWYATAKDVGLNGRLPFWYQYVMEPFYAPL